MYLPFADRVYLPFVDRMGMGKGKGKEQGNAKYSNPLPLIILLRPFDYLDIIIIILLTKLIVKICEINL